MVTTSRALPVLGPTSLTTAQQFNFFVKGSVFWHITPCTPLKVHLRFGGTYRLRLQGQKIIRARNQCEADIKQLISCLAYHWTLKMEATCSSETPVDLHRITRRYILEYRIFQRICSWESH
jgi:hypothetical protein